MRLVVDALCATHGGIATYVENLVGAWPQEFPEDELHVLTSPDLTLRLPPSVVRHDHLVRRPRSLFRPIVQTAELGRLASRVEADAVLATLPSTSVRRPGAPLVVVVHDLRHDLRPDQFSRVQRLLRSVSYARSYSLADAFVTISRRTLDDLHAVHPRLRDIPIRVVHHGADHVAPGDGANRRTGPAIAFGHHSNKNLDLVLDTWRDLSRDLGVSAPQLVVTGVSEPKRLRLARRLAVQDPYSAVTLAGYLSEREFETLIRSAGMIVFPSDFEGFGLPVLEAMRLRIPVVVSPDAALAEIAGGLAEVMDGWAPDALAAAVLRARAVDDATVEAAAEYAEEFTWGRSVRATREVLGSAVDAAESDGAPRRRRRPSIPSLRRHALHPKRARDD